MQSLKNGHVHITIKKHLERLRTIHQTRTHNPLDETHLEVVSGPISPRGFSQYVNKESSLERRNYVRSEQTDLYAYAKVLIQSGKV